MRDIIKDKALILAIISLSSLALSVHLFAPIVRAQSPGLICLAQQQASSCPSVAPVIPGNVGSQLRVAVFIQNSAPLGAFDVEVLSNHTIVRPSGVDLAGTVLLPPLNIVSECIGGVQKISSGTGYPCTPEDTDTIELAVYSCTTCGLTSNPTTGLLFTAIYNVTGSVSTPIGFQTGCSPSSVGGASTCVLVTNGGLFPVPETTQTATLAASSEFSLSASRRWLL